MDALIVLKAATKQLPALRYAWGVVGLSATAAIVIKLNGDGKAAVIAISLTFIGCFILLLLANAASKGADWVGLPAKILTWSITVFFIVFLAFTVLAYSASWPCNWVAQLEISSSECKREKNPTTPNEKPELGRLLQELESSSMERRILAVSQIANVLPKDRNEADYTVRALERYINRHGALAVYSSNSFQKQDISAAFLSLGSILKYADEQAFEIRPPEFKKLDLSAIDLTKAYLHRASFVDSILDDAILNGADLSNTFLTGVQFSRVQARGAKLASAHIQQICSEEAIFVNADLSGIEISSSDFNGANFKNANLSSSHFENSRLSYANFDGANMDYSNLRTALELTKQQLHGARSTIALTVPDPIFIKSKLSICKI